MVIFFMVCGVAVDENCSVLADPLTARLNG